MEFNWPNDITRGMYQGAANLHNIVVNSTFMEEIMAGYSGIGSQYQSLWIFQLDDYADLDLLMIRNDSDEYKAFNEFFDSMVEFHSYVKQEVQFI